MRDDAIKNKNNVEWPGVNELISECQFANEF